MRRAIKSAPQTKRERFGFVQRFQERVSQALMPAGGG